MVLNLINFVQVAFVWLLIIPDLLFSIHKEKREATKPDAASITEQFGRYASMVLMILPLGVLEFGFRSSEETMIYFIGNVILIAAYIAFYVLFFRKQTFATAMILSVLRIAVFLLCGILLSHWFLVVFAVIFAVGHLAVTVRKYKEK